MGEKCPVCGSEDVAESWRIGERDKFRCRDCGAKWTDGQREKVKGGKPRPEEAH